MRGSNLYQRKSTKEAPRTRRRKGSKEEEEADGQYVNIVGGTEGEEKNTSAIASFGTLESGYLTDGV